MTNELKLEDIKKLQIEAYRQAIDDVGKIIAEIIKNSLDRYDKEIQKLERGQK